VTIQEVESLLSSPAMPAITFILGGVVGFFVSRFSMTKAEKKSYEQVLYQNSLDLKKEKERRFQEFFNAMTCYVQSVNDPKLDDLFSLSASGNSYFNVLRDIADAIIQGKVDSHVRDNTFVPDIVEALRKNIPSYYTALKAVATRLNVSYDGEFKRSNYESLFRVVEKYASSQTIPPVSLLIAENS
jgi:hypothetical protein